jgi:hypothetical protein
LNICLEAPKITKLTQKWKKSSKSAIKWYEKIRR